MKIDFLSDLHVDFYFDKNHKIKDDKIKKLYDPIITKNDRSIGDILIIAGDIGHYNHQNIRVLKYLKEHYYKDIICVLGNHDYYLLDKDSKLQFKDSFERVAQMRKKINKEENIYCLDGDIIEIDGVKFGGCDSWYNDGFVIRHNLSEKFPREALDKMWEESMHDSKCLYGVESFKHIYKIEEPKIEKIYKECDVMITHISPSTKIENFSPRFQGSISNTFFSFEGEKYLKEGSMKYWIFGHTHEELEYEEHRVKCFCNPFGYPGESGLGQWVEMKSIEV